MLAPEFHIILKLMPHIPITLIEYGLTMVRRTHTIGVVLRSHPETVFRPISKMYLMLNGCVIQDKWITRLFYEKYGVH